MPIAVSAFSRDALERSHIDGGPNLVLAIPNVNSSKGNFNGYNLQTRGIVAKLVATSGDAATGIHLSNAPLISNKPSDRLEGMARSEYGNYNSIKLRSMINAPISDAFAVRLAGAYLKRDGFGKNTVTGSDADSRDMYGYRASVRFEPTDTFRAIVVYDKFHEDDARSRIGKQFGSKDVGPTNVGGRGLLGGPAHRPGAARPFQPGLPCNTR